MSKLRLYQPEELRCDGYPVAWNDIKEAVRESAGHRCVRCGHPYKCGEHGNGEWTPCDARCKHEPDNSQPVSVGTVMHGRAQWRILTVHHLDGNKANCEAWNLAALCQRCHLHIQGKVKMDQLFFEDILDVSPWFKPHLEGYIQAHIDKA